MNESCLFDNFYLALPAFRTVLCIAYSVTTLAAISLNSIVILTIWKTPHLHNPSYILLANVAFVDFFVGAIVQTSILGINIAAIYDLGEVHCYFTIVCRISGSWSTIVSLFALTVISMDRLLAVKLKNRYRNVVTSKRIWGTLLPWWFASLAVILVFLITDLPMTVLLSAAGTFIIVMLTILTTCYSLAFYHLRRHQKLTVSPEKANEDATFNASKYQQSLKTMVLAIALVLISYLPYLCSAMVMAFKNIQVFNESEEAVMIYKSLLGGEVFVTFNSTINPILFLWRMKDLREAARSKARRIFRG